MSPHIDNPVEPERREMKLADPAWLFDSPGPIPDGVVSEFESMVGKIAGQADDAQDVFELFKSYFSAASGNTSTWRSSNLGFAQTDLRSDMAAAAVNAPLFVNAFADGCQSCRKQDLPTPSVEKINSILDRENAGYLIQGDSVVAKAVHPPADSPRGGNIVARAALDITNVAPQGRFAHAVSPDVDTATSESRLRVFLCHGKEDKPRVKELYAALKRDGFTPWLDEEDLVPGEEWEPAITTAIRTTHVVIVCLSKQSTSQAGFRQKEIRMALDVAEQQPEGTIFVIPVRLEECNVPTRLGPYHWVNLYSSAGYEKLVGALKKRAAALEP
jgi:hypothetical protein